MTIPFGWTCPICHQVYAAWVPFCTNRQCVPPDKPSVTRQIAGLYYETIGELERIKGLPYAERMGEVTEIMANHRAAKRAIESRSVHAVHLPPGMRVNVRLGQQTIDAINEFLRNDLT